MVITKATLFKLTNDRGAPSNGGRAAFRWPLPTQHEDGTWAPGEWTRQYKRIRPCEHGYHLARLQDLTRWNGTHLWIAEHDDPEPIVHDDSKVVVRRARLVAPVPAFGDRMLRLFAADCAEHVLPLFEREAPGDSRPRMAIETARRFARGEADATELDASGDAARAAASAAAWDAARAAAWAAAWDAARAAARAAAWDAERSWQNDRLLQYLNGEAPQ